MPKGRQNGTDRPPASGNQAPHGSQSRCQTLQAQYETVTEEFCRHDTGSSVGNPVVSEGDLNPHSRGTSPKR
jgi:hypothetical protein